MKTAADGDKTVTSQQILPETSIYATLQCEHANMLYQKTHTHTHTLPLFPLQRYNDIWLGKKAPQAVYHHEPTPAVVMEKCTFSFARWLKICQYL